ncbi:MAG: cell surface protein, partial [Burkholderiales bacterium]
MKMKKNAVALSVATLVAGLGFAGAASADVLNTANATELRVNAGGIGHSLLQPYFSTQNGNVSLLSIVNTDTVNGKAVKLRFRGASNSDDLFDFQLFLSPGDVWTAQVSAGADGISRLSTVDKSCTLPDAVRSTTTGTSFVLDRLPAFLDAAGRAMQTREGYVEIFNMAD